MLTDADVSAEAVGAYERLAADTSGAVYARQKMREERAQAESSLAYAIQVRIRQHTSAYVSIRRHTSAYVRCGRRGRRPNPR
jgi:hypothetical protein